MWVVLKTDQQFIKNPKQQPDQNKQRLKETPKGQKWGSETQVHLFICMQSSTQVVLESK